MIKLARYPWYVSAVKSFDKIPKDNSIFSTKVRNLFVRSVSAAYKACKLSVKFLRIYYITLREAIEFSKVPLFISRTSTLINNENEVFL